MVGEDEATFVNCFSENYFSAPDKIAQSDSCKKKLTNKAQGLSDISMNKVPVKNRTYIKGQPF
jgi:hypothetical protein